MSDPVPRQRYRSAKRFRGAAMALAALAWPGSGWSQTIPFPAAPATAMAAASGFDARRDAILAFNACGREEDYARIRGEMAAENFGNQGEDLTSTLLAKAAWVLAHAPGDACSGSRIRLVPKNDDGSLTMSVAAFAVADRAARLAEPGQCASELRETASDQGVTVDLQLTPACMTRQVNESIQAMQKDAQLGTDGLVCVENLRFGIKGDFDVNVRELIRLLLFAGPQGRERGILTPETIDHMYTALLAARGPVGPDSYSLLGDCSEPAGDALGTPEDTADQHAWYNEVLDGIGDFFHWLVSLFIKIVGGALASAGGLVAAPFLLMAGVDPTQIILPHTDIRVSETENHRLMIESSRFLTNADIIARLSAEGYGHVDDIRSDQAEVRGWLMGRLQDIAAHDFQEYNARPYTRYSLNAVLNLHDFAARQGDADLQRAARIVLDLSEAKFAATSNRGRRIVPFRRLSENDGDDTFGDPGPTADLYNAASGADHEVALAMILAGQTNLLPGGLPVADPNVLVNAATSPYRLPPPVLAAAVERGRFSQTVHHVSTEAVFQSPAFTITAGGTQTPPTLSTLGQSRGKDRGVAMPTAIIPTLAGNRMADLFRFNGVGRQEERSNNLCVAEGFACGVQPQLSQAFRNCQSGSSVPGDATSFISSALCLPGAGPHFYLAARIVDCPDSFCAHGRQWGVMEAVEASPPPPGADGRPAQDPAYDRFKTERAAALHLVSPDGDGRAHYVTAAGHAVDFSLAEAFPIVTAVDGVAPGMTVTAGGVLDADGAGRATLKGAGGPVTIDFSDANHPQRSP